MNRWANAIMLSYAMAFHTVAKFFELLIVSIVAAAIPALLVVVAYSAIITLLS